MPAPACKCCRDVTPTARRRPADHWLHAALLPVSLIPGFTGHAGKVYLVGAGILGAGFSIMARAWRPSAPMCSPATADGVDYLLALGFRPADV